ncbi:MAG: hypothetical protein ACYTGS_21490, partial [Planctomycetota bacterium]
AADLVESSNKNQMVKVTLVVVSPQEYIGRKGFANLVLVPDAMWKLKEFCKAVGLKWDGTGVDVEPAIGRELDVKVTQEQYTDKSGDTRIANRFDNFVVPA